jgi:hypothetical protein
VKIQDVLKVLQEEGVQYAIIGGIAVVLYGYVRFTKDIDLIIEFSPENIRRLVSALSRLHFKPGVPVDPMDIADARKREEWMQEKNAKVVTFYNPRSQLLQIDVLLTKSLSDVKSSTKRIGNLEVSVVDYDDLIEMKKQTGRPTDLIDVRKLEQLKGS